jgi:hypothetical protein
MGARDTQFDLGAGSGSAPNAQLRTDLSGAFTHSGKAVVAGATVQQSVVQLTSDSRAFAHALI